jgi:flagellum-specific ATP synthase
LQAWPKIQAFLQQDADVTVSIDQTESLLAEISPPNL